MKRIITTISFLMILIFQTNLVTVYAEENKSAEIEVSSKNVEVGSSVEVEVSIKNNPGVLGGSFELTYDSGLILKSANAGDAFETLTLTKPGDFESGCKFLWDATSINDSDVKDGIILKLIFDVIDDAKEGDQYNVGFRCLDAINNNLSSLTIADGNGKISIVKADENKVLNNIIAVKNKITYDIDDELKVDDITVTAYYNDDSEKLVTKFDTNISDVDMNTAGEKRLIISYTEKNITKTSEIKITVKDKSISNNVKITVDNNVVLSGDQIDVNIKISDNPGIIGMMLDLQYDAKLKLLAAKNGEAFDVLKMTPPEEYSSNCKFNWDTAELKDADIKDGNILTLTFAVDSKAAIGDKLIISAVCYDAIDRNLNPVKINAQSGALTLGDDSVVVDNKLNGLNVSKEKVNYKINEELDLDDLTVVAEYNGGVTEIVTNYSTNINEIDMSTEGKKVLKVYYSENEISKSAEIEITVATEKEEIINDNTDDNQSPKDNPISDNTTTIEKEKSESEDNSKIKSEVDSSTEKTSSQGEKTTPVSEDSPIMTDGEGNNYFISDKMTVDKLKKGIYVADKSSGGMYVILKTSVKNGKVSGGTVSYLKPYNGNSKNVTVRPTIKLAGVNFKVTDIAKNAFKNNKNIKKVIIGKNVTKIGANAFNGCKKLSKITIKGTVLKSVGKNAIKGINKKAVIKVPKKKLAKYKKLFKSKTGYKKTMKIKK